MWLDRSWVRRSFTSGRPNGVTSRAGARRSDARTRKIYVEANDSSPIPAAARSLRLMSARQRRQIRRDATMTRGPPAGLSQS